MFEVATETGLSRTSRQPGRQHAGEVTKKKDPNQRVEAPPVFRGNISANFDLKGNPGKRDNHEADDDSYFEEDIYRQRSFGNSSQSASTGSRVQMLEPTRLEQDNVENDPRGRFYDEANRRARLIRVVELDRIEQIHRAERLSSLPAVPKRMGEWRLEKHWNRPVQQEERKTWKSSNSHAKCTYCQYRGTECYGAQDGFSHGCETCQRMKQSCLFITSESDVALEAARSSEGLDSSSEVVSRDPSHSLSAMHPAPSRVEEQSYIPLVHSTESRSTNFVQSLPEWTTTGESDRGTYDVGSDNSFLGEFRSTTPSLQPETQTTSSNFLSPISLLNLHEETLPGMDPLSRFSAECNGLTASMANLAGVSSSSDSPTHQYATSTSRKVGSSLLALQSYDDIEDSNSQPPIAVDQPEDNADSNNTSGALSVLSVAYEHERGLPHRLDIYGKQKKAEKLSPSVKGSNHTTPSKPRSSLPLKGRLQKLVEDKRNRDRRSSGELNDTIDKLKSERDKIDHGNSSPSTMDSSSYAWCYSCYSLLKPSTSTVPRSKFVNTGHGLIRSERLPIAGESSSSLCSTCKRTPEQYATMESISSWSWNSTSRPFWKNWMHSPPHRDREP